MRTLVLFGLLVFGLQAASAVHAQTAREHFRRGERAYQQGNYELAIREWQAAFEADPRPRIQYNLAQAYERLGQLTNAVGALERYISSADPDDPSYNDATARLTSLQQRLANTGIQITGGPDGAEIRIDGEVWGRTPRPDEITVPPGSHRVVIRLQGYRDFVSNVVVPEGQVVEVPVVMAKVGAPQEAGDEVESESPAPPPPGDYQPEHEAPQDGAGLSPALPWFIAAGGLGAAAIGSGVWFGNRAGELSGCDAADTFCREEDAVRTQRNIALIGTIAFGAGAVGALVFGLLQEPAEEPSPMACAVGPLAAQCGVRF